MRRPFFCNAAATCVLALFWMGCAKSSGPASGPENPTSATNRAGPSGQDYSQSTKVSRFGTLELSSILPDAYNKRRAALTQQALRRLELGGDFNTDVFALDGYETAGAVIARPRVFLRSSVTGERERLRENTDGLLVASVSIALVDGMASQLFTGKGTRSLPAEFLVRNREALLVAVEKALGKKPVFLAAVACPDKVQLRVQGVGQFPVQFKSKLKSCPINTFFPAEITFKKDEWEGLISGFAEGRTVEVEAKLNLATPLTLDYANFRLGQKTLRKTLLSFLKNVSEPFTANQIADAGRGLLDLIQKSFDLCVPNELFTSFQDGVVRDYLKPVIRPDCPNGMSICFFGNGDAPDSGEYGFAVRREEYVGRPLLIESIAPVSDYLAERQEFMLRAQSDSPLAPPQTSEVSQLFRTIQEGEVAEFKVKQLQLGQLIFPEPVINRVSNQVCIQPFALCMDGRWRCTNPNSEDYNCRNVCSAGYDHRCKVSHPCLCGQYGTGGCCQWEDVCRGWSQACDRRRICDRLPAPGVPSLPYRTDKVSPNAPDFAWDCSRYAQNQCDPDKWEDHWERVTTWSLPSMSPQLRPSDWKPEYWNRVLAGLSVRFSSATEQGTAQVVCPMSGLEHRLIGTDRLIITFRNTASCSPFNDVNRKAGYGPTISLLNQIVFPADFQCGSVTENWEGKRRYVCRLPDATESTLETTVAEDQQRINRGEPLGIHKLYYPRVELQGSLRMVGSYFESLGNKQGDGE